MGIQDIPGRLADRLAPCKVLERGKTSDLEPVSQGAILISVYFGNDDAGAEKGIRLNRLGKLLPGRCKPLAVSAPGKPSDDN